MNCILQASDGSNKIANNRLPKGCLVIAAVNPDDANHTVNMMDFALVNRFSVVTLDYDVGSVLAAQWLCGGFFLDGVRSRHQPVRFRLVIGSAA